MPANATNIIDKQKYDAAALGLQDLLVITAVPAGASPGLVGQVLLGKTLSVVGVYEILIPIFGFASLVSCAITATLAGGATLDSELDTIFYTSNPADPTTYVNRTAGTGDGSVTTATRQEPEITTLEGESFARLKLTLGVGGTAIFTQAEFCGK